VDGIYYRVRTLSGSQSTFDDSQGQPAGTTDSLYSPIQRSFGDTKINVLISKADYTKQFSAKTSLDAGAKVTYSRTIANSGIENLVNGAWVPDVVGQANNFVTYEAISAAYVSLHLQPDAASSLTLSARYEYSHNYTNPAADSNYRVDRKLGRLFPSLFFTHKVGEQASWNFSYTERITRPSYDDLASYISYNSPISVFTGNPLLKPTVTRNLKFGFSDHDYLFSLLFSRDQNPILAVQGTPGPVSGVVYLSCLLRSAVGGK
jgi:outer membrane receptor protein involved in Fe transport